MSSLIRKTAYFSGKKIKKQSMTEWSIIRKHLWLLSGMVGSSLLVSSVAFYFFETENAHIHSITDFLWWWTVTTSTVGYGDIVPISTMGRIAAVYSIIIGVYTYTDIVSIIVGNIQFRLSAKEKGKSEIKANEHVLICDYTAFADELIQEIKAKNLFQGKQIVLLSSLIERNPYPEYDFIYGVPISPQALERAHAEKASHIFVFSNNRFSDPDNKTLHVLSRIARMNQHAKLYVELHNESHELLKKLSVKPIILKTDDLLESSVSHQFLSIEKYLNK